MLNMTVPANMCQLPDQGKPGPRHISAAPPRVPLRVPPVGFGGRLAPEMRSSFLLFARSVPPKRFEGAVERPACV